MLLHYKGYLIIWSYLEKTYVVYGLIGNPRRDTLSKVTGLIDYCIWAKEV